MQTQTNLLFDPMRAPRLLSPLLASFLAIALVVIMPPIARGQSDETHEISVQNISALKGPVTATGLYGSAIQECVEGVTCGGVSITISTGVFTVSGNGVIAKQQFSHTGNCPDTVVGSCGSDGCGGGGGGGGCDKVSGFNSSSLPVSQTTWRPFNCPPSECPNRGSPIFINIMPSEKPGSNIYLLTKQADGILIDLKNTGTPVLTAWSQPGVMYGALIHHAAGEIPKGEVLDSHNVYGDYSDQPDPACKVLGGKKVCGTRNGFAALAIEDRADHGGNGDGWIDAKDQIYSELGVLLRLENGKLKVISLLEAGVERIQVSNPMPESLELGVQPNP